MGWITDHRYTYFLAKIPKFHLYSAKQLKKGQELFTLEGKKICVFSPKWVVTFMK